MQPRSFPPPEASTAGTGYAGLSASRSQSLHPSPTAQPSALRSPEVGAPSTLAPQRGRGGSGVVVSGRARAARTPRPGGRRGAARATGAGPLGPLNLPGLLRGPQPETIPSVAEQGAEAAGRSREVRTGPLGRLESPAPGALSVRPRGRGPSRASCANPPLPRGAGGQVVACAWLPLCRDRHPLSGSPRRGPLDCPNRTLPPARSRRRGSATPSPDVTAPPECLGPPVAFGWNAEAPGDARRCPRVGVGSAQNVGPQSPSRSCESGVDHLLPTTGLGQSLDPGL